jgi:hypothetical protein
LVGPERQLVIDQPGSPIHLVEREEDVPVPPVAQDQQYRRGHEGPGDGACDDSLGDEHARDDACSSPSEQADPDGGVGKLVAGLEAEGLLADSWVILTSDHGERLGETHPVEGEGQHFGNPPFDSLLRVPLIVAPPLMKDAMQQVRGQDLTHARGLTRAECDGTKRVRARPRGSGSGVGHVAQQLGQQGVTGFADLVGEEGASTGQLEVTVLVLVGLP